MIEKAAKPVQARRARGIKVEDDTFDFVHSWDSSEDSILIGRDTVQIEGVKDVHDKIKGVFLGKESLIVTHDL